MDLPKALDYRCYTAYIDAIDGSQVQQYRRDSQLFVNAPIYAFFGSLSLGMASNTSVLHH